MSTASLQMPRKPKPAQPEEPAPGKVTVRLAADLHRRARTVASFYGLELVDFLDQQLRPIVDRMFAEMGKAIQDEAD